MRKPSLLMAAAALIVSISTALGQDAVRVTVRGIVKTPQGSAIPGATLTVGATTVNVDSNAG